MDEDVNRDIEALTRKFDQIEEEDLDLVPQKDLVDVYILASELEGSSDDFRKEVGNKIQERMDGKRAEGTLGKVTRVDRTGWNMEDESDVLEIMTSNGVARSELMSVDPDKVEDHVQVVDSVDKEDVFSSYEYSYVQKSGVDDVEKEDLIRECIQSNDNPQAQRACLADFGVNVADD